MREDHLQLIVEGLKQIRDEQYCRLEIVITEHPQKIDIVPLRGKVTKVLLPKLKSAQLVR